MKKNTLVFLLLMAGFWAQAQSITYLSPLTQTEVSNADSSYLIPNGVVTNPQFDYLEPYEASQFIGSYLITASEMQAAGFVAGDNINSIAWELSQGQGESSTGMLTVGFVSTSFFPDFSQIPSAGFYLFPSTEVTIPNQPGLFELELAAPYLYDGLGMYITFYFIPTTYSSSNVLPLVGIDTNLSGGFINRFILDGDNEGSVVEQQLDSRPVTLLGKADCPFGYVTFDTHTETSATISWSGEGTYQIEYGLYPYEQGTGGTILPLFITEEEENQYVISDLEPGKAYNVYVRKECNVSELSQWSENIIGTSLETTVTGFPYVEDFNPTDSRYIFLFTRGWTTLPSSTPYADWSIPYGVEEGVLSLRDLAGQITNKTVYSRPLELVADFTYPISLEYNLNYFLSNQQDYENYPTLNILVNTSSSEQGATVISSLTDISNFDFQTHTFEFTPQTSGVYYIGLNGVFDSSPINMSTTFLEIDNFTVDQGVLSVKNLDKLSDIAVYPNPFNDFIRIKSEVSDIEIIQIHDMKGALLYENNSPQNEVNINVSSLTTGVYLIKATSGEHTIVKKIIKQ